MKITEKQIEKAFQKRLETVSTAVNSSHFNEKYLQSLPRESAYKLVSRYAGVSYSGHIEEAKLFSIKNGIWQEFLVKKLFNENTDFFEGICPTNRKKDIFCKERSLCVNEDATSTQEDRQCRYLCTKQINALEEITLYDYQVPIKSKRADLGCGKIDLIGASRDEMVIIEYKKPDSHEPLLRAVTEIITYFHQIDGNNRAKTYLEHFNKIFGLNCNKVRMAVVVPEIMFMTAHRYAFDLIKKYNILCYEFDKKLSDLPFKISNTGLERKRYMSEQNMEFVVEHSDEIVQALKNG